MAFTVEDGTQVANGNAYLTLVAFKAHHDDRGRSYATYEDTGIEDAIVKATDYLDKRFGGRFRGSKAGTVQSTEWPRNSAMDDDGRLITGLPEALLKAAAEYAYLALTLGTELAPVPSAVAGNITEEKVGPIVTKYGPGTRPMTTSGNMIQDIPVYPEADLWVERLLVNITSRRVARG